MNRILISGYYGFGNSGDDALLLSIIKDLKEKLPEAEITVLSADPDETESVYGVQAVDRWNIMKVMGAMRKSDLLISGGGTLIQDGTSTKSLIYYLAIIMLAHIFGMKIMLYSNGIGPLDKKGNVRLTKMILNKVNLITLRDEVSEEALAKIGVDKPKVVLTADPVFMLERADESSAEKILSGYGVDEDKKFFIVSVRKWKNLSENFPEMLAEIIDYTAEKYQMTPVFLPMQLSSDSDISKKIISEMKQKPVFIDRAMPTNEVLAVVNKAHMCIGMRLHTLIYAASQGVPIIGLVYDPKINGFMDYIRQDMYIDAAKAEADVLRKMIDKCMADYDNIKEKIDERVKFLREKANENSSYAVELLREENYGK